MTRELMFLASAVFGSVALVAAYLDRKIEPEKAAVRLQYLEVEGVLEELETLPGH